MRLGASTHCLLIHVHKMIPNTQKGNNPPKAFVPDCYRFFRRWFRDLDFGEELETLVCELRRDFDAIAELLTLTYTVGLRSSRDSRFRIFRHCDRGGRQLPARFLALIGCTSSPKYLQTTGRARYCARVSPTAIFIPYTPKAKSAGRRFRKLRDMPLSRHEYWPSNAQRSKQSTQRKYSP
jgi:hypothetical protein